jgi:hypothetical protein
MVGAEKRTRSTPRRKAQRQRKQLQRLLARLKQPMTETQRRRVIGVKVWQH